MAKSVVDELMEISDAEHKFVDSAYNYSRSHKKPVIIASIIAGILIIIIILFFLIKVPVSVEKSLIDKQSIVIPQVETRQMEFLTLVPYEEEQLKQVIIDERKESVVLVDECSPVDFEFDYSYVGDLSKNKYDDLKDVGYKDGRYMQAVEVCNYENETLQLTYEMCYWRGRKIERCKGDFLFEVYPEKCRIIDDLVWITEFDSRKNIFIEIKDVSQLEECGKKEKTVLLGKRPRTELVAVNVTRYRPEKEFRTVLVDTNKVIYSDVSRIKNDVIYVSLWRKMFG